jgi:diguanylate cyclase (GGDEF)-like protein
MTQKKIPEKTDLDSTAILDSIDAIVYLADMETYELVFMNHYGKVTWGEPEGKRCWEVLQAGQTGPCPFCTNRKLLDQDGNPTGVYVWEFKNTANGRWFHCRDQAIRWVDGRLLRMEIATDINDIKNIEESLKIEKEKAEILCRTDELTGISNRRAAFEEGMNIFKLAKRYQLSVSIIMLDVDRFKQVNDRYGHMIGDRVLVDFAHAVERNIREVDIFGRIGGEEFILILPETSGAEATRFAERLRTIVSALIVQDGQGSGFGVTCSFGVATCDDGRSSFEQVLARADSALYRAKVKGRNRVERDGHG